jgi:UDP-3-O-[3-hydroxymyristoyl] glucosamine N-acyltransferase
VVVPLDFSNSGGRTVIRAAEPRAAFANTLSLLYPPDPVLPGIHTAAIVDATAIIDPSAQIAANVSIEGGARVGAGTRVGAGSRIGRNTFIGSNCTLHANVTVYQNVRIGDRVVLHSGAVLGADGFGFVLAGDHYEKFPQIGSVVIHDDVEIGANTCIDRAALGVTEIGRGTKLDNMVHIAHNCRIGEHVVIAAQTGLSGGVVVGNYAVIGGQVGIGDKARIESRAVLGSGCGVLTAKIVRAGEPVWGTPARPLRQHLQQLASVSRLPDLRDEIAALKHRIAELEREK